MATLMLDALTGGSLCSKYAYGQPSRLAFFVMGQLLGAAVRHPDQKSDELGGHDRSLVLKT